MTDTTKPNGDRYRPSDWEAVLRATSAERGWLGEPPQVPAAGAPSPSHRYKWHKMMGATNLLPDEEREAIRQAKQRADKEEER